MIRLDKTRMLALLACLLAGCGHRPPYDLVAVSGQVTYEDGQTIPADRIILYFYPQADSLNMKTHARPARVEVDVATGKFEVASTRAYGDGVVAGRHRVTLLPLDAEEKPSDLIPPAYQDAAQTPLEVDTAESPFHFQIPRP